MAESKKYFWLKLKRDFFKRHDVRIIEEMPNGKDYILFYLKLLLESIDHEGELRFSDAIPYNEQMLAVITNTNVDIVRSAMKVFVELNMIEIFDDKTIYMAEVQKLIGSETAGAERVRKHRENRKMLHCNALVTKCNTEIELEKDKELDKEYIPPSPKATPKHKHGEYGNVRLTDEEHEKLAGEYGEALTDKLIAFLDEYIEMKGYKAKSHYLAIKKWVVDAVKERETKLCNSFDTDDFFEAALQRSQNGGT